MRAIRVVAPGSIELADIPEPPDTDEYVVRPRQVGICGTDTKILAGKIPVEYPRVMGHELVGEVVSGPDGGHFSPGDRVLVDPGVACGWCDLCLAGKPHICRNGGLMGRDFDGAFTEYVVVPERRLVSVPHSLSDRSAGMLQVLGTCVHAVGMTETSPGQVATVIGLGVAGQLLVQLLTLRGLQVIGITRSEWKRSLAAASGAVEVASPDLAGAVVERVTEGRGPDLVVEAVGTEATLASAIEMAAIGGQLLVYGTLTGGGEGLPYYHLYHKELTIYNPRAAVIGDYANGVALAADGRLSLDPIVTHELTLEDAEQAFEVVHDSSSLKVLMAVG